jgi:hypothetical protein
LTAILRPGDFRWIFRCFSRWAGETGHRRGTHAPRRWRGSQPSSRNTEENGGKGAEGPRPRETQPISSPSFRPFVPAPPLFMAVSWGKIGGGRKEKIWVRTS